MPHTETEARRGSPSRRLARPPPPGASSWGCNSHKIHSPGHVQAPGPEDGAPQLPRAGRTNAQESSCTPPSAVATGHVAI